MARGSRVIVSLTDGCDGVGTLAGLSIQPAGWNTKWGSQGVEAEETRCDLKAEWPSCKRGMKEKDPNDSKGQCG